MWMNDVALMTFNGAVLSRTASRAVSFGWLLHCFSQATVFSPRHIGSLEGAAFKDSGGFILF
jgi:hypothetical protein